MNNFEPYIVGQGLIETNLDGLLRTITGRWCISVISILVGLNIIPTEINFNWLIFEIEKKNINKEYTI